MNRFLSVNRKSLLPLCTSVAVLLVIMCTFGLVAHAYAQDAPPAPTESAGAAAQIDSPVVYVPGQLLVMVDPALAGELAQGAGMRAAAAETAYVATADACVDAGQAATGPVIQVWQAPVGQEETAMAWLRQQPGVLDVQQDLVVHAAQDGSATPAPNGLSAADSLAEQSIELKSAAVEAPYTVNDPLYPNQQWGPQRANLPRGWQLIANKGLPVSIVRVGVLDSGVDFSHPDLAGRLLPGKNYITTTIPADDYGHGTHVSGIIAAVVNNGIGVAGSTLDVRIDPRKVLDYKGDGSLSNMHTALCEAVRDGDRIINMSFTILPSAIPPGSTGYQLVKSAVDYAYAKGALMVAAAGNHASPNITPDTVEYPARFDQVVAVAALTYNNQRASYSATGPALDIAAPGGDSVATILSTWPSTQSVLLKCPTGAPIQSGTGWYCGSAGTSMAAPNVTGVAALIWSVNPTLSADQVRSALVQSARSVGLVANYQGAGLVDAEAAVRQVLTSELVASPSVVGGTLPLGTAPFTTTVVIENPSREYITVTNIALGSGQWFTVTNFTPAALPTKVRYGEPAYLTVVISPTYLMTGTYASTITINGQRADATALTKQIAVVASVNSYGLHAYLPAITNNAKPTSGYLPFTWETPISTTTVYTLSGNGSAKITLPFAFPLAGPSTASDYSYWDAEIYADGFINFLDSSSTTVSQPAQNKCLPALGEPRQAVFGWWADLDPSATGAQVSTFRPANDRFVIEYLNVPSAFSVTPAYRVSFQIVLFQSGKIQLNYQQAPKIAVTGLKSVAPLVTIGAQAHDGLYRNQTVCTTVGARLGLPPQSLQSLVIKPEEIY